MQSKTLLPLLPPIQTIFSSSSFSPQPRSSDLLFSPTRSTTTAPEPVHQTIEVVNQLTPIQVANYNIQPPPVLHLSTIPKKSITITAWLVLENGKVLSGGFHSGEVQVIRAGQRSAVFSGLKLAKIGPIKAEIQCPTSRTLSDQFYIRFFAEDTFVDTNRFQIVSSCSQMPNQIRNQLRPNKRLKKNPPTEPSSTTFLPVLPIQSSSPSTESKNLAPMGQVEKESSKRDSGTEEAQSPSSSPASSPPTIWLDSSTAAVMIQNIRSELETAIQNADTHRAAEAAAKLASINKHK